MTTEVTCKYCHYTRKPTDDAPEWACPQCQKVYGKTGRMITNTSCKNHPSKEATWRCNDCGVEFCAACVTPHRHAMSYLSRSIPFATCPECKGMCIDFKYAEKLANGQLDEDKAKRKHALRVLCAGGGAAAIPIFTLIVLAPVELSIMIIFLLLVVFIVLFSQRELDNWIGGDSIFPELNTHYSLLAPKPRPKLTMFLFIIAILSLFLLFIQRYKYYP